MQTDDVISPPTHPIVADLQQRLAERADSAYAIWYRHNVKPSAPVRGVRMQDLRHLVMAWNDDWQKSQRTIQDAEKIDVTFLLLQAEYVDDRLAAMVFIDEILIPAQAVTADHLDRFATLFPKELITDFKACDHFAAKVLQPLLIRYGSLVSGQLSNWFRAKSVWQARAALSALTPLASDAIHDELLISGCAIVLSRPEEEAKSIVGSALRALGKVRPELVEQFLNNGTNLMNTNAACLNKATSFLETGKAQHFREQRRMMLAWSPQHTTEDQYSLEQSGSLVVSQPISLGSPSREIVPAQSRTPFATPTTSEPTSWEQSPEYLALQSGTEETYQRLERRRSDQQGYVSHGWLAGPSDTRIRPGSSLPLDPPGSFVPPPRFQSIQHERYIVQAHQSEQRVPGTNIFAMGQLPVVLPRPMDESRSTAPSAAGTLGGVAHGRITRADSGLRRRVRRIPLAEHSPLVPPSAAPPFSNAEDRDPEDRQQNPQIGGRGVSDEKEGVDEKSYKK